MSLGRVNYRSWLLRVLTWDTLLPACVGLIPHVVELLFPDHRGVMEVVSVTLPIVAFFLRFHAGKRQIESNRCSEAVRGFQFFIFTLGILPLVLVDCFMILSHLMPEGALFATKTDLLVWTSFFVIYLTSMVVAMYPGPRGPDRVKPF
jgi:hypothetical protein